MEDFVFNHCQFQNEGRRMKVVYYMRRNCRKTKFSSHVVDRHPLAHHNRVRNLWDFGGYNYSWSLSSSEKITPVAVSPSIMYRGASRAYLCSSSLGNNILHRRTDGLVQWFYAPVNNQPIEKVLGINSYTFLSFCFLSSGIAPEYDKQISSPGLTSRIVNTVNRGFSMFDSLM